MNGKPPDMLFLPNDFLPTKKKLIDERHGYKIWTSAVHFDRSLPDKNPDDFQMQSFLNKIMLFYEDIYDNLTKCLLSHLTVRWNALQLGCNNISSLLHLSLLNQDQGKFLQSSCGR